jgi:hypothetical protein
MDSNGSCTASGLLEPVALDGRHAGRLEQLVHLVRRKTRRDAAVGKPERLPDLRAVDVCPDRAPGSGLEAVDVRLVLRDGRCVEVERTTGDAGAGRLEPGQAARVDGRGIVVELDDDVDELGARHAQERGIGLGDTSRQRLGDVDLIHLFDGAGDPEPLRAGLRGHRGGTVTISRPSANAPANTRCPMPSTSLRVVGTSLTRRSAFPHLRSMQ